MKYLASIILVLQFQTGVYGQNLETQADFQHEISRVRHIIDNPPVLDSLVRLVYDQSGLLRSFDQEMGIYDEEILQKKRNWVSSFRLGLNLVSAETYVSNNDQSITNIGVLPNLGLTLAIDPEKFVNRKSYVRQATNKKQRSYYLQQDHKQRLKKEILNLHFDYLIMLECIVLKEHTLNTRKQHLSVMEVEFKGGTATYDQLLIVQNQYNLWETEYVKSKILALKRKREIEVILGL